MFFVECVDLGFEVVEAANGGERVRPTRDYGQLRARRNSQDLWIGFSLITRRLPDLPVGAAADAVLQPKAIR